MSSPGLYPYNGNAVRKKTQKVEKQGGFMRLCAYCGLILKERDALAAAALGFVQGFVRAVEPVGGRRHPRAGSCPRTDCDGGQTGEDHGSQQLFDRLADRLH